MRIQKSTAALLLVVCTTIGLACSVDRIIRIPNDDSPDPLYRFIASGKAGYIHRNGVIVIPARFASALKFSDGWAAAADSVEGPYYCINIRGEQPIPERFLLASSFFKGLAHVRLSKSPEYGPFGRYAYINTSGRTVFTYNRRKPPDEK